MLQQGVSHIINIVMGSFFIKLSILVFRNALQELPVFYDNVKSRLEFESIKGLNRGRHMVVFFNLMKLFKKQGNGHSKKEKGSSLWN